MNLNETNVKNIKEVFGECFYYAADALMEKSKIKIVQSNGSVMTIELKEVSEASMIRRLKDINDYSPYSEFVEEYANYVSDLDKKEMILDILVDDKRTGFYCISGNSARSDIQILKELLTPSLAN